MYSYGGAVYHITGNVAFSRLVLTYDKPGRARWSGGQENSTDFLFHATNIARIANHVTSLPFLNDSDQKNAQKNPKLEEKKYFWSKYDKMKNNLLPLHGIG